METKRCSTCHVEKPLSEFFRDKSRPGGHHSRCKQCYAAYRRLPSTRATRMARLYERGLHLPMNKNRQCSSFLGVHVAERVLEATFENVERMPYGNPGFDFICGAGYKIDVKSSCRRYQKNGSSSWAFGIDKNCDADYFLCIAFDNREHLNPEHLWLIGGS